MWLASKAGHRRKSIALNDYIRNKGSKTNHPSLCFKNVGEEDQIEDKSSRRKEIKIRTEIDARENRKILKEKKVN